MTNEAFLMTSGISVVVLVAIFCGAFGICLGRLFSFMRMERLSKKYPRLSGAALVILYDKGERFFTGHFPGYSKSIAGHYDEIVDGINEGERKCTPAHIGPDNRSEAIERAKRPS